MGIRWVTGVVGAPSPVAEAFWSGLLPVDGDRYLRFGPPASGLLDLHDVDVAGLVGRAESLGGQRVSAEGESVVCRSPAGLLFAVVPWAGQAVRPVPVGLSLVDQVCLDIPVGVFEVEVDFWAALSGWARRPVAGYAEFEGLVRGAGLPLRLLFQRVGGAVAGAHLDLACADVPAEVARHVGLGAVVVRARPGDWTTLRDPAGREYCLTSRWPG